MHEVSNSSSLSRKKTFARWVGHISSLMTSDELLDAQEQFPHSPLKNQIWASRSTFWSSLKVHSFLNLRTFFCMGDVEGLGVFGNLFPNFCFTSLMLWH